MKNIYLFVGESGSGKTTITEKLSEMYGFKSIQSYTTRLPRYPNEKGHIFVSNEEFNKLTDIIAYTEFAGNKYCATAEQIDENDMYVIDPKGVDYLKVCYHGDKGIKVIYVNSSFTARYERMHERCRRNGDTYLVATDKALERIVNDVSEFYTYVQTVSKQLTPEDDGYVKIDYVATNQMTNSLDSVVRGVYNFIMECEAE